MLRIGDEVIVRLDYIGSIFDGLEFKGKIVNILNEDYMIIVSNGNKILCKKTEIKKINKEIENE